MIPNPKLIPRFNIDYDTKDFISAITQLKSNPNALPITSIFNDVQISFTNSGRTSLYMILKALKLPIKSNIGVPLYSCTSVFDAIINAGHIPVFLDIDPNNYTLMPEHLHEKINNLEAVVVIHTFGRPVDLDEIQKIAGSKPVIEDCAHALLSRYKGRLTGTIATAGFFSFRTGKYISAGEGGMIVTKNSHLALEIEHEIEKLVIPSVFDEIKHAIITYARSALYHKPWFGLVSLPLGCRIKNKVDFMNKNSFRATGIRSTEFYIIVKKFNSFQSKVERQRQNSIYLIKELSNTDLKLPHEATDTYCNYCLFPIQFNSESERNNVCEFMRENGIDTAKLFSMTPEIAKLHYGYKGDCPNTEEVAERILTIPNYYTLSRIDLNKIINLLIRYV